MTNTLCSLLLASIALTPIRRGWDIIGTLMPLLQPSNSLTHTVTYEFTVSSCIHSRTSLSLGVTGDINSCLTEESQSRAFQHCLPSWPCSAEEISQCPVLWKRLDVYGNGLCAMCSGSIQGQPQLGLVSALRRLLFPTLPSVSSAKQLSSARTRRTPAVRQALGLMQLRQR